MPAAVETVDKTPCRNLRHQLPNRLGVPVRSETRCKI